MGAMPMTAKFDVSTLNWVKGEIDASLDQARLALEAFLATPDDETQMGFCVMHLHQVRGTLQMVELYGAARAADEMELLAVALQEKRISEVERACEVLMRAVLQLPDYLEGLQGGQADNALVLLALINEMRRLRGEQPLPESDFFQPDLTVMPPPSTASGVDIRALAQKARPYYQSSLLHLLRGEEIPHSLKTLRALSDKLLAAATEPALRQWFWVFGGFVESLAEGGQVIRTAAKRLLSNGEQVIRQIGDGGEHAVKAESLVSALTSMLFQVAQAHGGGARLAELKAAFGLGQLLAGGAAPAGIGGFNAELKKTLAGDVLEELATIQDALDIFVRSESRDAASLLPLVDTLARLASTLAMMGQTSLQQALERQAAIISELQGAETAPGDDVLMGIASAVLAVDSALRDWGSVRPLEQADDLAGQVGAGELSPEAEAEHQRVIRQVMKEARSNLLRVKDAVDAFVATPADAAPLAPLPGLLHEIIGSLSLLSYTRAAQVLRATSLYISNDLAKAEALPGADMLDALADALTSIEYYMDAFVESRVHPAMVLEVAERAVAKLGYPVDTLPTEAVEEPAAGAEEEIELAAAPEEIVVAAPPEEAAAEPAAAVAPAVTAAPAPTVAAAAASAGLDPEIVEIFIEEATEEIGKIVEFLPRWQANRGDTETLRDLRRSFHTLKGSGRTVGLDALGEIAWAVEKLLNVVIENDVVPSANQLSFIEKASAAFSGWVAELLEKGTCEPSFIEWQAEAQVLEAEFAKQKPVAEAAEVLIGGTRKISRALFNIFLGEAKQHLQTITKETAKLEVGSTGVPAESLVRSAHTLASNAGATGFKALSDLSRALENWLDVFPGQWNDKSLTLLGNVVKSLTDMLEKVEALVEPKRATALLTALKKATEKASQAVPEEEASPVAAIELVEQPVSVQTAEDVGQPDELEQAMAPDSIEVSSPLDQELLTIFTEEARELVPQIGNELRAWRKAPQENSHPDALQRALHTLKGSARMAGQSEMGNVVHNMEGRVIQALKKKVTPADFDDMFQDVDSIGVFLEELTGESAVGRKDEVAVSRGGNRRAQFLRMRADMLDRLINEAGEVSIARSRMEQEMQGFKHFSLDLTESVFRLRSYLRELEIETESQMQSRMTLLQETQEAFDPLEFDRFTRLQELTRMMAESVNDVSTIQNGLLNNLDETESALQQQARMNRELQYGLMNVRMVPFSVISERLHRIVRQTAHELSKPVELTIDGESVDIDRSVLDKIGAPLEHLLRNSVGHGIEPVAQRKKLHKPETGSVQLKVKRENDEIVITVADDGAGIKLDRVREKAIQNGLIQADQETSEQSLMAIIFEPGFSTAADVTQISGRGVGLDAVRGDITALGGRIEVFNSPEHGAVFTIYLPVTLSVAQVVLVRSGTHLYALPSIMVEQLQKLKTGLLAAAYEAKAIHWADREYPIHYFSRLIGEADAEPEQLAYTPILLLRSGTNRIALHVDEIIGNQEVVMKPIGSQLARVPGITGATVMGDGKIVLIVNPVQMANREVIVVSHARLLEAEAAVVAKPTVMVVDDSLTMRKVLGRTLEREGYQVVTAKDGMDALQLLQETRPDIILLDIEMPRMDGFEFARNVRGDADTAGIPIIMISSRTAEKHQSHAKEIGVNAFLGKPVQDDDLLAEINTQLGHAAVTA